MAEKLIITSDDFDGSEKTDKVYPIAMAAFNLSIKTGKVFVCEPKKECEKDEPDTDTINEAL